MCILDILTSVVMETAANVYKLNKHILKVL